MGRGIAGILRQPTGSSCIERSSSRQTATPLRRKIDSGRPWSRSFVVGWLDNLDVGVGVKNAIDNLTVIGAYFESVEPEFVVLAMSEPGAGLDLPEGHNCTFDHGGPDPIDLRDLLDDANACAWKKLVPH